MTAASAPLLDAGDPSPFAVLRREGAAPFVLIGDHAGRVIPRALGTLGVSAADLERHIALDIGVAGMGAALAERLNAVFVRQTYSRLVVDCNRAPDQRGAIVQASDGTPIRGNIGLSEADRARRFAEIHEPYQQAIGGALASRPDAILVALHSFTPSMNGVNRPWQVGILHHLGDTSFALAVLERLRADGRWTVGDNQPYRMDGTDYTVPRHAYPANRRYVEFEVRQDLVTTETGQREWAGHLGDVLLATLGS